VDCAAPRKEAIMHLPVTSDEAVALLSECINTKTVNPPGDEARLTEVLARYFQAEGISTESQSLAPGRANLCVRLPGTGGRPALILSGHTDTVGTGEVPWEYDPWSATVVGERLYGRGASDMKSGLAAMVLALVGLKRAGVALRGDLVLAASAGEEVNLLGARAFVDSGALAGAGAVIVGEPTGGRVAVAHKGAMWLAITTLGRTAHGSMPDQGINAILRMQQVIERVRTMRLPRVPHPLLGASTLSINTIRGGAAVNVVPDRCRVDVDIRTVPGTDHEGVVTAIRSACGDLDFDVALDVLMSAPAVETDAALPAVQTAIAVASRLRGRPETAGAVPYFTEASIYQSGLRVPAIIYGPGEAELAHQPNEWVSIPAYLDAVRFYAEYARAYLA